MTTITCTRVFKHPTNGRYYLDFSDGAQKEFENLAAMQAFGASLGNISEGQKVAAKLLVASWLAKDALAVNSALVVGKVLTFDPTAPSVTLA